MPIQYDSRSRDLTDFLTTSLQAHTAAASTKVVHGAAKWVCVLYTGKVAVNRAFSLYAYLLKYLLMILMA